MHSSSIFPHPSSSYSLLQLLIFVEYNELFTMEEEKHLSTAQKDNVEEEVKCRNSHISSSYFAIENDYEPSEDVYYLQLLEESNENILADPPRSPPRSDQ